MSWLALMRRKFAKASVWLLYRQQPREAFSARGSMKVGDTASCLVNARTSPSTEMLFEIQLDPINAGYTAGPAQRQESTKFPRSEKGNTINLVVVLISLCRICAQAKKVACNEREA